MRGANNKITIWNKHKGTKDVFKRSVIDNCSWETEIIKSVTGTAASVVNVTTVLVAENKDYKPFKQWAIDKVGFTFSVGDMVAYGDINIEIAETGELMESKVRTSLLPNVFNIKAFADETEEYKKGKHYELSGV